MKEFKEYKEEKKRREQELTKMLECFLCSPTLSISVPENEQSWIIEPGLPGYDQIRSVIQKRVDESKKSADVKIPLFTEFKGKTNYGIEYLTESENTEIERWSQICEDEFGGNPMDEGFLSKLVGGVAGFLVGPAIGKIIANALGVEHGILYDMFTSRLVSAVLGTAIAKQFGGEYNKD